MKFSTGQMIATFFILISILLITYQATRSESSVTFYTPAEVYERMQEFHNKNFRISGLVVKDSKRWNPSEHSLRFQITDLQGHDFDVHYHGVPPDLFKEGQGVVIEGRLISIPVQNEKEKSNPFLAAHLLMVKHSEVYDTKQDHSKIKQLKLLDSMKQ